MKITRVGLGPEGQSRFEDVEIELDPGDKWAATLPLAVDSPFFRTYAPDGHDFDWHPAHARQFVVLLGGAKEIEVGDGTVRAFRAGDVLFMSDIEGQGHITRTTAPGRLQLAVPVAADFDFDAWVRGNGGTITVAEPR